MIADYPVWLRHIQDLRKTINQPTLRELEVWTSISRSRLSRYFSGRTLPTEIDMLTLLAALDANQQQRHEALASLKAARTQQRADAGKPSRSKTETPNQIPDDFAKLLTDVADSMRGLTDTMSELIEELRHHQTNGESGEGPGVESTRKPERRVDDPRTREPDPSPPHSTASRARESNQGPSTLTDHPSAPGHYRG